MISCAAATVGDRLLSVALSLLSTEAGGFQEDQVAPVAAAAALDFLASPDRASDRFPGLRVVLAAEESSQALQALRDHVQGLADAKNETRLVVKACALPDVGRAGMPCAYIVNPCNWRLVAGGGRTNVLVNRAAGDCLRQESLKGGRKRALVAEPIPVKLSSESNLRAQGVDTVIQILGPNLDPRFPDCLADRPDHAGRLLRQCYDKALELFWELATRSASASPDNVAGASAPGADAANESSGAPGPVAAAAPGPAAAAAATAAVKGGGGSGGTVGASAAGKECGTKRKRPFPEYRRGPPAPAKVGGYWKTVLQQYLEVNDGPRRPEMQSQVFYEDDQCLVIYDGYPKSRYHLLLLPKPKFLKVNEAKDLRRDRHLSNLRQLHATGAAVAEALSQQGAGVVRCGYHGIPSLRPLHLHIISQDFDSDRLKKRSHYNSFTTEFFLESSWVEARLQERGTLELDTERLKELEATPLRCFKCGRGMVNMGALKDHNRRGGCTAQQLP